jgi:protein SCO1/2
VPRLRAYHVLVRLLPILAFVLSAVVACSRPPEGRRYPVTGQVLAVHPERDEILIRHDEITGFMDAMTMPFGVKDKRLIEERVAGDIVRGTLFVGETTSYLEALEKTGFAPVPAEDPVQPSGTLAPGEAIGDIVLRDQNGKERRLSEFRGKALALTFIFTRCPLPDFCPALDRAFARLHALLAKDVELADKVQLLSVSFDPEHDTPAVLARHAGQLGADGRRWLFATGVAADVDRLGASFGLEVTREAKGGITHNLRTALVDPGGRLLVVVRGSDWKAEDVLGLLRPSLSKP